MVANLHVFTSPSLTENEQCTDALLSVQSLTFTEKVFSHAVLDASTCI